jgi:hypothetical protein
MPASAGLNALAELLDVLVSSPGSHRLMPMWNNRALDSVASSRPAFILHGLISSNDLPQERARPKSVQAALIVTSNPIL